ncbi:ATP-dependent DNA ligase clustered with Ku protein, LigD (plasmid) [Sinorhizobium sp. CCBAU 05631]|nr:ATP-dependent DNA ligase clustered with Ku protein, LigD [Sinorhizobium sp. CCBAU 05631]
MRSDSFVIVGFEPSTVPGAIGRPLLAARRRGGLVYVGGCATGWTCAESAKLRELLEAIRTDSPAVNLKKKKRAVFVEPVLVANSVHCGRRKTVYSATLQKSGKQGSLQSGTSRPKRTTVWKRLSRLGP